MKKSSKIKSGIIISISICVIFLSISTGLMILGMKNENEIKSNKSQVTSLEKELKGLQKEQESVSDNIRKLQKHLNN